LIERRGVATLEDAFILYLEEAERSTTAAMPPVPPAGSADVEAQAEPAPTDSAPPAARSFDARRLFSYARREGLELRRDPIRLTLAILGSAILMLVLGYGISMDVENMSFAA